MKRIVLALSLAILGAAFVCAQDEDEKIIIKVGTQAPKGTVWMNALEAMAKEVKEKTKVEFVFFAGGVMGDESTIVHKIEQRQLGAGLFTGIGLGVILPEVRILELPFFYKDVDEIDKVKKEIEPDLKKHFDDKGYVFLGWAEVGWAYIFTKDEAKNLEDLRKLKIWRWADDPLAERTFTEFGLAGTPLSLADVLTSLEHGAINAVYNSPYGLIGLQWHSKIKFMSKMTVGHGTGAFLVGKKEWAKIPPKKRERVAQIARTYLDKLLVDIRKKNDDSIKELEGNGVKVTPMPEGELADYEKRGAAVAEGMAGDEKGKLYTKDWLERVKKVRDEARKK